MCFHSESEMQWFLDRAREFAAIIVRRPDGHFVASWLVDPADVTEIPFTLAALRKWHPAREVIVDLSNLNGHRLALGLSALDYRGLPAYEGEIPAAAEDTVIGQEIKDLLATFKFASREAAYA